MSVKVGLVSLGCAKNLIDSEIMIGHLAKAGMSMTPDAAEADVVIVNTCSFIDASKHEALEAIYEMSDGKATARKKGQKLIVAGCMSQRYQGALPVVEGAKGRVELPKVDAFIEELVAEDVNSPEFGKRVDSISNMGRKEIAEASGQSNRFLDRPVRAMDKDSGVGANLAELRKTVESLDPGKKGALAPSRKILGMPLIWGFKKTSDPNAFEGGQIYNAENGKIYSANISLQPDGTLRLRGYVGSPMFGETQIWTRAK